MSLIRARRRRKKNWIAARKGMAKGRLMGLLVLTLLAIWYLGWRF
ncbi:MAG: hypothetical protein O2958_14140 [Gemmatimonadetes bacterium]|nr:hypothetical protein [Gemmatimonadota bacterium]MDA1104355.1 hypothetical protein [Gemmatimonadota bacterium]